jgi:hypothetical protein
MTERETDQMRGALMICRRRFKRRGNALVVNLAPHSSVSLVDFPPLKSRNPYRNIARRD